MTNAALRGKPYAGNPHVRFEEGEVAPAKPRHGFLLYTKTKVVVAVVAASAIGVAQATVSVNAESGQVVQQGAVVNDGLSVSGLGTVWMTGNNTITSLDMSGMSGTSPAKSGGTLLFAPTTPGGMVTNAFTSSLQAKSRSTLILSNSVTTASGANANSPYGRLCVYGGKFLAAEQYVTAGDTAGGEWKQTGTLYFDDCVVTGRVVGVTNGGQYGHVVVTNNANVYASGKFDFPSGELRFYSGCLTSAAVSGHSAFGGLLDVTVYHTGGTLYQRSYSIIVGTGQHVGRRADYYFSGGEIDAHGGGFSVGETTAGVGYFYQSGGLLKETHGGGSFYVGQKGTGYYEITGGTVDIYSVNNLTIAKDDTSTGELRLLGGTVIVNALVGGAGNSTVTFNGGTFQPNLVSKTMGWLTKTGDGIVRSLTLFRMGKKGGTFQLNKSNNTTVYSLYQGITDWAAETCPAIDPADYLTVGALTKAGGTDTTLIISNACSYTCGTAVDAGTLKLYGDDTLPSTTVLRIKAGATVDLNGTTQHVKGLCGAGTVKNGTLVVSGYVMPGYGDEGGTLTFTSATVTSGGLAMYVKNDGQAVGDINGTLTLTANANLTAVNSENIKDGWVSLTFGSDCTLVSNGVKSTLPKYLASINGRKSTLAKGGLLLMIK